MLPAELKQIIARLPAKPFQILVEALLTAECRALNLSPGSLTTSDDIDEADGGLDAVINGVPESAASPLPEGLVGVQLKSTKKKIPSAFKLKKELDKPGPRRIVKSGGTYILVSSQDLNDPQRRDLLRALQSEADKIAKSEAVGGSPKVAVWEAQILAELCQRYPQVVADFGLAEYEMALSLEELREKTGLRAHDRPFESDPNRKSIIEGIEARVSSATDAVLMILHGDPGTGKTRVVSEALTSEDIADQVLYVKEESAGWQPLLNRLVRSPESSGILIVDDVDDTAMPAIKSRLEGAGGRWRVIFISNRPNPRMFGESSRNAILLPLEQPAMQRLIRNHSGLTQSQAEIVAEATQGFPDLGFILAEELRADPDLTLGTLAQLSLPQNLMARLLPDAIIRSHLAPIALFRAVGFEDDVRYQLEAVADAFGLDPQLIEHHCQAQLDRLVSQVGRYRLISPLIVAIWLATDLIRNTPDFDQVIAALPETLQESFIEKLDDFGPGVEGLGDALSVTIGSLRFRNAADFDAAAGRLLRASAAIIPSQVATSIQSLVSTANDIQLETIPRRDLVWACEYLLWWPETWEAAIESLYRLAQHESETWANNATAQFQTAFTIFLSGSTLTYADRAEWLQRTISRAEVDALPLLGKAAAQGLSGFHSRMVATPRGAPQVADWVPRDDEELIASRRLAWNLCLEVRDRAEGDDRVEITQLLAGSLRIAYRSNLQDDVQETLSSRMWGAPERQSLASGLRDVLQFEDELGETLRSEIQELHDNLMGGDLESRIDVLVATPIWKLQEDRRDFSNDPPILLHLADELSQNASGIDFVFERGKDLPDQETRGHLFQRLALLVGPPTFVEKAIGAADSTALSAGLLAADESGLGDWVTQRLSELAYTRPEEVMLQVSRLKVTDERIRLALALADSGVPALPLASLLYGARVRSLSEETAVEVVRAVARTGALENALGMVDQRIETGLEAKELWQSVAFEVAESALKSGSGTMSDFHIERMLPLFEGQQIAELWRLQMSNNQGIAEPLDRSMTQALIQSRTVDARHVILDFIEQQSEGAYVVGLMSAGQLSLLSMLADAKSAEEVWAGIEEWDARKLRLAIHHMDWSGSEPTPLVRRFLLSDRLTGLEGEANTCFFNTLGVVSGPMHMGFARELNRAKAWRDALIETSAEPWANDLVSAYEVTVLEQKRRDDESSFRWRV